VFRLFPFILDGHVEAAVWNMEPFFMLSGSSFIMMAQAARRAQHDPYLRRCFDILTGTGAALMLLGVFA
jgi:hypothetical protein